MVTTSNSDEIRSNPLFIFLAKLHSNNQTTHTHSTTHAQNFPTHPTQPPNPNSDTPSMYTCMQNHFNFDNNF